MRTTLRAGKPGLKEGFLPRGPDLVVHLPEGLSRCEHWQLHPSRHWKLNQTVRDTGKVFFIQYFPTAGEWYLSLLGTSAPCPGAVAGMANGTPYPCPVPTPGPGGRPAAVEEESAFKDNHCRSVHHQLGWDIKSPRINFSDSKLPIGYFLRKLHSPQDPQYSEDTCQFERGLFKFQCDVYVATRKQEEIE